MQAKLQHRISAIVFNLGYLPGSDHTIQTNSTTTITALDACLPLLCQNGLLLVTAYRGHPGGMEEAEKVEKWMQQRKSCKGWKIGQEEPQAERALVLRQSFGKYFPYSFSMTLARAVQSLSFSAPSNLPRTGVKLESASALL